MLAYPEGNWKTRRELTKRLAEWQKGQLYFFANDPSMPAETRAIWSQWGYAADEFVDNDHFPRAMYVRDARRMVRDDFVFTAHTVAYPPVEPPADDPVAVSYWPTVSISSVVLCAKLTESQGCAHGSPNRKKRLGL